MSIAADDEKARRSKKRGKHDQITCAINDEFGQTMASDKSVSTEKQSSEKLRLSPLRKRGFNMRQDFTCRLL